ncbi:hypothetical protein BG842_13055 [Haladaptatus sp. W1]|uniref:DUF7285 family protein n=1 Tax=Haladaptatus sp. W1 TaxID=1897478 RepID=UPI000849ADD9|nr:hypothetical protein [Haladaptatus sp. W1]ODR83217.1 hypothetical protein BG842_13025 [Haladaptatus sp. W1]ODR83222.1 hypothetical protein BG842_13055 [Haladaptatus sp. W1]
MRRWSPGRAQTEPVAAIVAVFAVCFGLLAYTGVLGDAMPRSERTLGPTTLPSVRDAASSNGILIPTHLTESSATPDGYRCNVTLTVGKREWHDGPTPPSNAKVPSSSAATTVSVRIAPGDVRPGRLRVVVWK